MLEPKAVRTYDAVREAIDAKLGDGRGLSTGDAAAKLDAVEHVVWALDNLFADLFEFRFHIWDQGFNDTRGYDGARWLSVIAEQAREANPLIADLLSWTSRWARTRGIALVSVVPELWAVHGEATRAFLFDVAARWPQTLEARTLTAPTAFVRAEPAVAIAVGFTPQGASCAFQCKPEQQHREGVFRAVLDALWRAGASDDTLDAFFKAYFERGVREVDVVCEFVSFDGDGGDDARKAALQQLIQPVDAFAQLLGVAEVPLPSIVRIDSLEQLSGKMSQYNALRLSGSEFDNELRRSLRMDPDALVFDASHVTASSQEMLISTVFTGHMLIVAGNSAVIDAVCALATGVPVLDRRTQR